MEKVYFLCTTGLLNNYSEFAKFKRLMLKIGIFLNTKKSLACGQQQHVLSLRKYWLLANVLPYCLLFCSFSFFILLSLKWSGNLLNLNFITWLTSAGQDMYDRCLYIPNRYFADMVLRYIRALLFVRMILFVLSYNRRQECVLRPSNFQTQTAFRLVCSSAASVGYRGNILNVGRVLTAAVLL